jgi:hypothetical protein
MAGPATTPLVFKHILTYKEGQQDPSLYVKWAKKLCKKGSSCAKSTKQLEITRRTQFMQIFIKIN